MNSHKKEFVITRLFHIFNSSRWVVRILLLQLLVVANFAWTQSSTPAAAKFNHIKTGFSLVGAHAQIPCGSCHVQGVFKV